MSCCVIKWEFIINEIVSVLLINVRLFALSDVNECLSSPCDVDRAICRNTAGSFKCECKSGYIDENGDGSICRGNSSVHSLYSYTCTNDLCKSKTQIVSVE